MVMEAPPSPQSVGREFVRQYYTLLNKAPTHLHRFYNHQSSFIHGGLDPPNRETSPVIGQKQIHQKIQQLNFRDCHAKITQVDSQATLGNGVVVQVTGELSNAGQPMRRFTQTFVLAAQSPKKYYVHNDIFRYQDEIVSEEDEEEGEEEEEEDEGCEGDGRSDQEEDVQGGQVMMDAQLPINQPPVPPYYPNAGQMPAGIPPVPIHHSQQQQPQHVINAQAVPTVNGAIHPDDINNINVMQGQVPTHVPAAQVVQAPGAPMPGMPQGSVPTPIPPAPIEEQHQHQQQLGMEERMEDHVEADWADYGAEEAKLEVEEDSNVLESSSNEPKTYANLLKSGGAVPFAGPPAPQQQQHQPPLAAPSFVSTAQPPRSASPPPASGGYQPMGGRPGGPSGRPGGPRGAGQGQSRMPGRQDSVGRGGSMGGGRSSMNEDVPYEDRRRSQSQTFNDVNQLFLGNLPHCAGEDDLRAIFADFGAILDLRVHSKPSNNGKVGGAPVGRAPPNYGFITFETQQGVQNCLQAKPIYYPKDDKNGTLLNVEEKKTKDRPSYGGGRPNTDGRGGGRGDNGGPRRGGMGGMGGSTRGGLGPNRPNAYSSRGGGPPNRGSNAYNRR